MDPFAHIAIELNQEILEWIHSLQDLQAAILASRSLHYAYEASRRRIRGWVFYNQILSSHLTAGNDLQIDAAVFTRARCQIETLEQKAPEDGTILRESLWPLLAATHLKTKLTETLLTWSCDFAEAYRVLSQEQKARHVEAQTLHLLEIGGAFPGEEELLLVKWVQSTLASCSRRQQQEYGADLWDQVLSCYGFIRHQTVPRMLETLHSLCPNNGQSLPESVVYPLETVVAKGWALFWRSRDVSRHSGDVLCYDCLDGAKALLALTKLAHINSNETLLSIEKTWMEMQLRSPAATFWAGLVVKSHQAIGAGRLEGVLKIWRTLREVIPTEPAHFETHDLNWAREVILELRKEKTPSKNDHSLDFQASVLALINTESPQYYAFARNLADEYLRNGDIGAAMKLRERIWQGLQPSSRLHSSWGRELINLYRKGGREEDAMEVTRAIKREAGGSVNQST